MSYVNAHYSAGLRVRMNASELAVIPNILVFHRNVVELKRILGLTSKVALDLGSQRGVLRPASPAAGPPAASLTTLEGSGS